MKIIKNINLTYLYIKDLDIIFNIIFNIIFFITLLYFIYNIINELAKKQLKKIKS
jgi:hypothetical protein